jgi:hypothetical protein
VKAALLEWDLLRHPTSPLCFKEEKAGRQRANDNFEVSGYRLTIK